MVETGWRQEGHHQRAKVSTGGESNEEWEESPERVILNNQMYTLVRLDKKSRNELLEKVTPVTVVTCCDDTFIFRRYIHRHMLFMFDCSFYYVYHCYAKTLLLSLPGTQHYCCAISTFIYLFHFDIYSYTLTYL